MKNLKLVLSIVFMIIFVISNGQNPSIEWQKCVGGSDDDDADRIIRTSDGGYLSVGHTFSNDYDASDNHSSSIDWFVVKFSINGNIEWKKCIGGTDGEFYPYVIETTDGEYMIVGSTDSDDGDVIGHHGNDNGWSTDAWIVKIDHLGNIVWQKCYGGSEDDDATAIVQTLDGGYLFVGKTSSNNGDLQNLNFFPYNTGWIVKIDSIGTIEWQKLIGGSEYDELFSVSLTSDNGFIVSGSSTSDDGDVQGNIWYVAAWVIKLNSYGVVQWQKCIGRDNFNIAKDIKQCSDGYIVACDKNHLYAEDRDGFIVKLSSTGTIVWQKDFGGNRDDYLSSIFETPDGGFIVGGTTSSWEGNIPLPSYGYEDCWILKLSSTGNIEWQRRFGGNGSDILNSIVKTNDNGFIFAGSTESRSNDVIGLHTTGSYPYYPDMWIVKLSPNVSTELFENIQTIQLYPNPAQDILKVNVDPTLLNQPFQIFSITGQLLLSGILNTETSEFELNSISEGVYLLQIGNQSTKFVKIK